MALYSTKVSAPAKKATRATICLSSVVTPGSNTEGVATLDVTKFYMAMDRSNDGIHNFTNPKTEAP